MNICPVCKTDNAELDLTCGKCGAFLRDRVAALGLFSTIWQLIESPNKALRKIITAEQKNYIVMLQIFSGIWFMTLFSRWVNLGLLVGDLQILLLIILIGGVLCGIMVIHLFSYIVFIVFRSLKLPVSIRNIRGIIAYSSFPLIASAFFIIPLETGIFGKTLFTSDPSPFTEDPVVSLILASVQVIGAVWFLSLVYIGIRTTGGTRVSALTSVTLVIIVSYLLLTVADFLVKRIADLV